LAGRANGKGGGLLLDTHYPHGAGRVDFAQRSTWAISANEETDAEAGVLDVKIQADTVNTGSGMKNGKLKGKDFFDVNNNPVITFHSTKLVQTGPTTFDVPGTFTIRGVSKPEKLNLSISGKG